MQKSDDISYEQVSVEIRKGGHKPVVFTNGCFDVIHPGHISVLKACRDLAGPKGCVVVGLNSDASVFMNKGQGRPVMDQEARARVVLSVRYVDHVVVFDEITPKELIDALRPDIIVKGGDYKRENVVGKDNALVVISPTVDGYSTTDVVKKIRSSS